MSYKWPLATNNFTFLDRLKICEFFLNDENRWTQDKYVREYEKRVAEYVGCKYAVFVSSGSTANQLIAQYVKDSLIEKGQWPKRNKVIVGAVTWQTNVSPWVREGFEPIFIDVNLKDFCLDYDKLRDILHKKHDSIACVFPTSVLGFTPDLDRLSEFEAYYPDIKFALDNCENFLGESVSCGNICRPFTSSTSCFIAHQISTGQEGGFIFTNEDEEYKYFLLSRAHGLLRNLNSYSFDREEIDSLHNSLVHPQFDFQTLSSNYRSSDIAAFMGLLDFKRVNKYKQHRIYIYQLFYELLDKERYYLPHRNSNDLKDVAFCLPIICKGEHKDKRIKSIKQHLEGAGIESRGFISGNMLRQKPYQKYGKYEDYKNAEYLNNCALYVGINPTTTYKNIKNLTNIINNITVW